MPVIRARRRRSFTARMVPPVAGLQERRAELLQIDAALDRAVAGHGTLVVVEGPAGIGKTRLLRELRERGAAAGATVLAARGTDYERDFAFGVARQLLERRLLASADRERMLRGAASLAAVPLALPGAVAEAPSLDSPDPAYSAFHGLYWLIANLAAERPVVLVIDDAHWADLPSLRFCSYLARRLEDLPVLVALGARPTTEDESELVDTMAAQPEAIVVRPRVLSTAAIATMAAEVFAAEPDEEFAEACRAATGGVPFFVTELLRALEADGIAPVVAERDRVLAIGPPAVTRSVLLRIGVLPAPAGALVGAIAVLGTEATLSRAGALAGLPETEAASAADALAAAHLLAADGPLDFAHPIIAATVESEMRPGERARLHAAAARMLYDVGADPSRVAHLLAGAEPCGEEWRVEVLRRAAADAVAGGASQIAARLLRRALEEPPVAAERASVLAELGAAELRAGDPAAIDHLRAALDETPGDTDRAHLLARALAAAGRGAEAVEMLGVLADELAGADHEGALLLEGELASIGTMERALAPGALRRLARHHAVAGMTRGERLVLVGLAQRAWVLGRGIEESAATAERALGGGALLAEQSVDSVAYHQAVFALIVADGIAAAEPHLIAAREEARRRGSFYGYAATSANAALARLREGRVAEAEGEARAALGGPEHALITPMSRAFLVFALMERAETAEAEAVLEPVTNLPPTMPANHVVVARARVAAQRGDWAAVRRHCEDAERREAAFNVGNPILGWRLLLAAAVARNGDLDRAQSLIGDQAAACERWGSKALLAAVRRVQAMFVPPPGTADAIRAALDLSRQGVDRLNDARALVDLGASLRRANERVAAREPLTEALELARQLGATHLVARAHKELQVAGARPRRLQFSGIDSLTAAERRVVELAVRGCTNREIAQNLFVTAKTIENHLGRAYRKLGVGGRDELAGALGGPKTGVGPS